MHHWHTCAAGATDPGLASGLWSLTEASCKAAVSDGSLAKSRLSSEDVASNFVEGAATLDRESGRVSGLVMEGVLNVDADDSTGSTLDR